MEKKPNNHAAVPVKIDELKKHHPEIIADLKTAKNSTEFSLRDIELMEDDMLLYPTVKDYVLMRMQKRKKAFVEQWQKEFETVPKFVLNAPDEEDIKKAEEAFQHIRSSRSFWLEGGQPNEIRAMFTDGDAVVSVGLLISAGLLTAYPERAVSAIMSLFEECNPIETIYYECANHALTTDSVYF
jgi:spermidine/putrescine-binding protein